ncbi:hypothetical protein STAS_09410 [Striga asiatica]|uniref:Uncharacterized protein n=1 Tax=Striga asiatica TaxID=4170 RepID=A0A5A7PKH4_STRAF|nr:hypothetical protein STAS_09410 [Striga asiatica]
MLQHCDKPFCADEKQKLNYPLTCWWHIHALVPGYVHLRSNAAVDDELIERFERKLEHIHDDNASTPTAAPRAHGFTFTDQDDETEVELVRKQMSGEEKSIDASRTARFVWKESLRGLKDANKVHHHKKGTMRLVSDGSRIQHLERRIRVLEGELMEAAAIEFSLYSVAAEHGSSMSKVHAPARRLSRLYFTTANQHNSISAAKSIALVQFSGLLTICRPSSNCLHSPSPIFQSLSVREFGPRFPSLLSGLTFWLSNSMVLRVIVNRSSEDSLKSTVGARNGKKECSSPLKRESKSSRDPPRLSDRDDPQMFAASLESFEVWISSRIIESLWWQIFTPHMQSGAAKAIRVSMDSHSRKLCKRTSSCSVDHQQGNFSVQLWKKAFQDACERLCTARAEGHDCGCLPVISKLIMEQLIGRLDVAMFNAILRESADEIPTDPVADPISDAQVLPIPAGKASFGAGAQLKNAIGDWSRWLTDLFGMDDMDGDTPSKPFRILNALSDLMMLPKDMLLRRSIREEVCPSFGPQLIRRIVKSFVPDEFCSDPIPGAVLEALNAEDSFGSEDDSMMRFPCAAAAAVYMAPSASALATSIFGQIGSRSKLKCSKSSVLEKSQTSDDELDQLNSPLKEVFRSLPFSRGNKKAERYKLLLQAWMNRE